MGRGKIKVKDNVEEVLEAYFKKLKDAQLNEGQKVKRSRI